MDLVAEIEARLMEAFHPSVLEVIDESYQHVGHAGSKDGARHFKVIIKAKAFEGLSRIEVHRQIYKLLRDRMPYPIHALSINSS